MSENDQSASAVKRCPFDGCDWSKEYDPNSYDSGLDADFAAEMHYEREHAGRVRIRVTLEVEQLLGSRDPEEIGSRALDRWQEKTSWTPIHTQVKVVEDADDHPPSDAEPLVADGGQAVQGNGQWTFDCNKCSFSSDEDTEVEALDAANKHLEYGPGHWDFTVTDPEGVEQYP